MKGRHSIDNMNNKDNKERMYWIREGNKLWNDGNIQKAEQFFTRANYQSGLVRVAEHYLDQKLPLKALTIYSKYKMKGNVEEMYQRMAMAISRSLNTEPKPLSSTTTVDTPTSTSTTSTKIQKTTISKKDTQENTEKTQLEKTRLEKTRLEILQPSTNDSTKMKRGNRKGEIWKQLISEIKSKRNILFNSSQPSSTHSSTNSFVHSPKNDTSNHSPESKDDPI